MVASNLWPTQKSGRPQCTPSTVSGSINASARPSSGRPGITPNSRRLALPDRRLRGPAASANGLIFALAASNLSHQLVRQGALKPQRLLGRRLKPRGEVLGRGQ